MAKIAALFGEEPQLYQEEHPQVGSIWSITHRSQHGNLQLLVWPKIGRVDLNCGPHNWIASDVRSTELISGLEVIFQFGGNGLLIIAVSGHATMIADD